MPPESGFAQSILGLFGARKGHFLLESGHHGDLWLELEMLCARPVRLRPLIVELARRLQPFDVEVICGPLVEGSFIGLLVASEMSVSFAYSEPFARPSSDGLFPIGYRLPALFSSLVREKRVAIVNDVINAGSAVRGTLAALKNSAAQVVAIGTLLTLGSAAGEFAALEKLPLETLAAAPNTLWEAAACPWCKAGMRLDDLAGFRGVKPQVS